MPARIGVPLDLGSGLSNEVESPEFATVAVIDSRIPGSRSEQFTTVRTTGKESKLNLGKTFKRIQEFFDKL